MGQTSGSSLGGRLKSFGHAFSGIRTLIMSQPNARIHAAATVTVMAGAFLLGLSRLEWCVIILTVAAVWTSEALNTALEYLADAASPEFHPLIKKAKDVAAGGVLLAALGSVIVGLLVFGPRLLFLLKK
ncbi:MAG: diacylglycerol kinase family protein [Deltaproteobacteria bacterium]|nr:diacylglycerol kinase family protein [Deltaproteobacteria bacterium]